MSLEANNFRLGVFFLLGAVGMVLLLAWLAGWLEGTSSNIYACYFSWSVQGIEQGSSVRYNGVPVGRVEKIGVADDGRLIEILLSVDDEFPMGDDLIAKLDFIGITGLKVINLKPKGGDAATIPELSFEPDYPVIPVTRGSMETLESGLERITEIVTEVDFEGLSERTLDLLDNLNRLLDSEMIEEVAESVVRAANSIDNTAAIYSELGTRLLELTESLQTEAPDLAGKVDRLAQTINSAAAGLDSLRMRVDLILVEGGRLARDLRDVLNILEHHPEDMLVPNRPGGSW